MGCGIGNLWHGVQGEVAQKFLSLLAGHLEEKIFLSFVGLNEVQGGVNPANGDSRVPPFHRPPCKRLLYWWLKSKRNPPS
ncbi:unnamed protein product [Victoria cruziana]